MYHHYLTVIRPGEIAGTYDVTISGEAPTPGPATVGAVWIKCQITPKVVPIRDLISYMVWKFPPRMSTSDRKNREFGVFRGVRADLVWLKEFINIEYDFHLGGRTKTHRNENFYPPTSKVRTGAVSAVKPKPWHARAMTVK